MSGWHFVHDSSHLLVGWWRGPSLQWEFGAYVNFDLTLSERHDYRWTYNYPAWRLHARRFFPRDEPLPRFQFKQ